VTGTIVVLPQFLKDRGLKKNLRKVAESLEGKEKHTSLYRCGEGI